MTDARITLDEASLLVEVDAETTVADLEAALAPHGLTLALDVAPPSLPVGTWLAEGAHGARDAWLDPVDQLLAGLTARLHDGRELVIRPAPRRAVGPDLTTLVVGARGRFARLASVWLRVHRQGIARPSTAPFDAPRDPALTPAEEDLLAAIARELAR